VDVCQSDPTRKCWPETNVSLKKKPAGWNCGKKNETRRRKTPREIFS